MTQHQLVKDWIIENGSILPAKMAGKVYKDTMFGSETSKRCRELRKKGTLISIKEGRFERFFMKEETIPEPVVEEKLIHLSHIVQEPLI